MFNHLSITKTLIGKHNWFDNCHCLPSTDSLYFQKMRVYMEQMYSKKMSTDITPLFATVSRWILLVLCTHDWTSLFVVEYNLIVESYNVEIIHMTCQTHVICSCKWKGILTWCCVKTRNEIRVVPKHIIIQLAWLVINCTTTVAATVSECCSSSITLTS